MWEGGKGIGKGQERMEAGMAVSRLTKPSDGYQTVGNKAR